MSAASAFWRVTFERALVRRLSLPDHVRVVAVGGATLGGSGKTPLAIACTIALSRAGARAVLVGHAYRARPKRARFVCEDDSLDGVGDEAIVSARALSMCGARVAVAPKRALALAFAAKHADVLVLDGVAQTSPRPACLSLLALDAAEPWGRRGKLFPCGELRASPARLLAACDVVVPIAEQPRAVGAVLAERFDVGGPPRPVWSARAVSRGVELPSGEWLTWEAVRGLRTGLVTALARPERVMRSLAGRGVHPVAIVSGRDHGFIPGSGGWSRHLRKRAADVELWLATGKCALHASSPDWRRGSVSAHVPVGAIHYALALDDRLGARLRALVLP